MEFDKSKVYTVLNANKVKIGSRGYFAENLKSLRDAVEENIQYGEISEIKDESFAGRFRTKGDGCCYSLFYLIEEPKKKVEFRAYNDMNEMIEDFGSSFGYASHGYASSANLYVCPCLIVKKEE